MNEMNEVNEDVELVPQGIPEPINRRREAIWIYLIGVIFLGIIGTVYAVGPYVLAALGREVPDQSIGAGIVLSGLVAVLTVQQVSSSKSN